MLTDASPVLIDRLGSLSRATRASPEAYLAGARAVLRDIAARPAQIDVPAYPRKPGGFTRNLVHAGAGFSVWALVWSPGARTPIHDHHCSCCFGVVAGAIRETWFRAIDDAQAVITADAVRMPGYVACMMPTGPNIHQMINDGAGDAVSIHIYGYDHDARASSVDREYRLAARAPNAGSRRFTDCGVGDPARAGAPR